MADQPRIAAIVLAAGESRRMGERNKLLLSVGGRPLVEHVMRAVTASAVDEVVVVVGHEADRVQPVLAGYPVRVVRNPDYAEGMTTSIRAGVAAADPDAAGFMICLSDLPLIEPEEFTQLADAFREAVRRDPGAIVRPVYKGEPGNPVVFSAAYRPAIAGHQGLTGCKGLIKQHRAHVVEIPMATDHVVCDVDTPEAYAWLTSDALSARRSV